MPSSLTVDEMNKWIQMSPFMVFLGIECTEIDPDAETVRVRMPIRDEFGRGGGGERQLHGGVIASLIDSVGDFGAMLYTSHPVPTINFRVDYLRGAGGDNIWATAIVRRVGRTVGVVDIDVVDENGRLIAVGRGTYHTQTAS